MEQRVEGTSFESQQAPIAGSGRVIKTGTGIFELTSANNYQGGTTVSEGTLQLSTTPSTLSSSSEVDGRSGATLKVTTTSEIAVLKGQEMLNWRMYRLIYIFIG